MLCLLQFLYGIMGFGSSTGVKSFLFIAICMPLIIQLIICINLCNKINSKYSALTLKGRMEKEKWDGFKRYIEENSLIEEKEYGDIILWEKYLIFATVFGISEKVLKDIKVKYPLTSLEVDIDYNHLLLKAVALDEIKKL